MIRYLAARPDVDAAHIVLWGDSFATANSSDFVFDQSDMQEAGPVRQHQAESMGALLATLAGVYEDGVSAVAARGGLVSFRSVLEDRFSHVPQDIAVPGILEIADIPDIVAAQTSRPMRLEALVDGRNRTVREGAAGPNLASWLAAQCARSNR